MSDHINYSVIHYSGLLKQPLLQSSINRNIQRIDEVLKSRVLLSFIGRIRESVFSAICDFSSVEYEEDILEVVMDYVNPWAMLLDYPHQTIIDALSLLSRDNECHPYFKFEFSGDSSNSDDIAVTEILSAVIPLVARALNSLDQGTSFAVYQTYSNQGSIIIHEYSYNNPVSTPVSDLEDVYFKLSLID